MNKYGYFARQPIFDQKMKLYGYELLFRESMLNFFPEIDGDLATSELISNTLLISDLRRITGGRKAFINFTHKLITTHIPLIFPKGHTVIEILEDVLVNDDLLKACRSLHRQGYQLAIDDYTDNDDQNRLLPFIALIKIDFRVFAGDRAAEVVNKLRPYHKLLVAEKLETRSEFLQAEAMGFDLFQGHFFSQPEIIRGKTLSTPKINLLKIMSEVSRRELDLQQLEDSIRQDVTVSYKMLRLINSSYYRRATEIASIRQAIVLLGLDEVRRFVSLIAMAKLAEGKPGELIQLSAIRAKFCEHLGSAAGETERRQELFMMGLFSLLDVILDESMSVIMAMLPLSQPIKKALIHNTGELSDYLSLVRSYENARWDNVAPLADALGIDAEQIPSHYMDALQWGQMLTTEL